MKIHKFEINLFENKIEFQFRQNVTTEIVTS